MIKQSIVHKVNRDFCYSINPQIFVIRLITARNDVSAVNYLHKDKYLKSDSNKIISTPMKKVAQDSLFDYYEVQYKNESLSTRYCFEIIADNKRCYYSGYHFYDEVPQLAELFFTMPKRMHEIDSLKDIPWMNQGIVYQIFPDRFNRGTKQTKTNLTDWDKKVPGWMDKFGGTLNGITEKLDYLSELGINIIYLTPIFKSPSSHKYDTTDYMKIDEDFGSEQDLKTLVDNCHAKGMHVILDCVFDHSGSNFAPFKDLLEKGEHSEYADWFHVTHFPISKKMIDNRDFDTFSYYGGMPKLNVDNEKVREYVSKVVHHWMDDYKIDGWRLDVADEVAHSFWVYFRRLVKSIKPDAPIIGEVWYDPSDWLHGDEFDSSMNYPFSNAVNAWIANRDITPSDFINEINFIRGNTNINAYNMLWNLIDSHDSARFLHCTKENKNKLKLAVLIQMTMSGTPMIYYGDEVGMTGGNDPECRRGMVWDKDKQDLALFAYYKKLIALRKDISCLYSGQLRLEYCDDIANFMVYSKEDKNGKMFVAINNSDEEYIYEPFNGKKDLITDCTISSVVPPYTGFIYR